MRIPTLCVVAALLFASTAAADDDVTKGLVTATAPHANGVKVICWVLQGTSQIVIFRDEVAHQPPQLLYQSTIEGGYLPKIHFIEEIRTGDIPLILVERNWGASIARLEVFGMTHRRMARLAYIEGYQFDIDHVAGQPVIVAHNMEEHEDIRTEYHWNGRGFVAKPAAKGQKEKKL